MITISKSKIDIITLIKDIQLNDTQSSWNKLLNTLNPFISSYSLNTSPRYRQDLKQELYIEAIKAVRKFKIKK